MLPRSQKSYMKDNIVTRSAQAESNQSFTKTMAYLTATHLAKAAVDS